MYTHKAWSGLITDSTNSPFTRNILPYVYLENPDQKLKWNVYRSVFCQMSVFLCDSIRFNTHTCWTASTKASPPVSLTSPPLVSFRSPSVRLPVTLSVRGKCQWVGIVVFLWSIYWFTNHHSLAIAMEHSKFQWMCMRGCFVRRVLKMLSDTLLKKKQTLWSVPQDAKISRISWYDHFPIVWTCLYVTFNN